MLFVCAYAVKQGIHLLNRTIIIFLVADRKVRANNSPMLEQYFEAGGRFIDKVNICAWWEPNGMGGESEPGKWLA